MSRSAGASATTCAPREAAAAPRAPAAPGASCYHATAWGNTRGQDITSPCSGGAMTARGALSRSLCAPRRASRRAKGCSTAAASSSTAEMRCIHVASADARGQRAPDAGG
eukprot:1847153-Pyramimonas_sp.AAC.1